MEKGNGQMITIKDVARVAGVSASTVSRALSGRTPVEESTRRKVLEAAQKLNYQPNALAKGLKEGRTGTIGLIVPNICNPVFPLVSRGVEDTARKFGYTVILCNTDEDVNIEMEYIQKLRKKWVDGIILATSGKQSGHITELKDSGLPVVLLIRRLEDRVDAVVVDHIEAARQAVAYLIRTGHRKIAMVNGDQGLTLYRERFQGYLRALRESGLAFDPSLALEIPDVQNCYESVLEFLAARPAPDAVFAASDPMALQVMRAVKDAGYRVPDDISVMGFDDLESAPFLDPPLTTVRQPLYQMGAAAAERIISQIEGKASTSEESAPFVRVMNTELIVRQSTRDRKNQCIMESENRHE
ncbi:LacI family DNA-binding transcriptional regulator [Eubacteriales bacterium mix99]|jgi:LacI family transcriptional regulator